MCGGEGGGSKTSNSKENLDRKLLSALHMIGDQYTFDECMNE